MKQNVIITLSVLALLVLVGGIYYLQVEQTILGISEMRVSNGKGYWVVNAVADSLDEKVTFFSKLPDSGELSDGTKIVPQDALQLVISKQSESCQYFANKQIRTVKTGLFSSETITFYTLSSPERFVYFKVTDDRNNAKVFDGTVQTSEVFYDSDGKGEATIQSVGILGTKTDCPEGSDVVVLKANENTWLTTDFEIEFLDESDLIASLENVGFWSGYDIEVLNSDAFIRDFTNGQLTFDGTKVTGTGISIGQPELVITADQDYFNSVVITPSNPAEPKIVSVDYPKDITSNSVESIKVGIKNTADNAGKAFIVISSSDAAFTPSSETFNIDNTYEFYSNMKVLNNEETGNTAEIEVCGVSQIGSTSCDTETISWDNVGEVINYCGNGICEDFESTESCNLDCKIEDKIELECNSFQYEGIAFEKDYGLLGWRRITNNPIVSPVPVCKTQDWVFFAIGGVILLAIVAMIVFIPNDIVGVKKK